MATLAESFLADLEDLEDLDDGEEDTDADERQQGDDSGKNGSNIDGDSRGRVDDMKDMLLDPGAAATTTTGSAGFSGSGNSSLQEVAPLTSTTRYKTVVERVKKCNMDTNGSAGEEKSSSRSDSRSEELSSFILDCNILVADMDSEVHKVTILHTCKPVMIIF